MTEIFLDHENAAKHDFQGIAPLSPTPETMTPTLLVYTKLSYTHETHYLTTEQVNELFLFTAEAHTTRKPLNRFITIHMKDLKEKTAQACLSNVMEKTRKWLQRNGYEHAYIWTLENGPVKGIHAHILIHIPSRYMTAYKRLLAKWLPFEMTEGTLDCKTVKYPPYGALGGRSCVYGALRYMCKGIDPATPLHLIKPEYQGEIIGRRCGWSKL
ncbi:MAG: hypothetical protein AAB276_00860 [Pseudomonadota bacterium]